MTQYELKFKSVRDIVDLRDFSIQIEKAVRDAIFRKVAVTVYEKYYELDIDPTRGEAKDIGEKISLYCPGLRKYKKEYIYETGISTQLFKKKETK